MKILQISDIHYREASETWALLKEAGRQFEMLHPDLILITGDLTNDGLDEQFLRMKRFVASLDFCPVLIIPGNRDLAKTIVPIPAERSDLEYFLLTHPEPAAMLDEMDTLEDVNHGRQGKFFDHFSATEFFYRSGAVAAVGLNSTPEITPRQMEMTVQHFNKGLSGELRIFCAHHSFLPVPTKKLRPGDVVPRSADILQTLIELNVDLLFCPTAGTVSSAVMPVPCWTRPEKKIMATWRWTLNAISVLPNARCSLVAPRFCISAHTLAPCCRSASIAHLAR